MGGSFLTATCEFSLLNLIRGKMHSLYPASTSGQPGTCCHRPLAAGASVSNPAAPCKGNHAGRNHSDAFCNSTSLQAFCLQFGKLGECLQLIKCQMVQELRQLPHHRNDREFLGFQPEVGFVSRLSPCLYGCLVLPVAFTGRCLHVQSGAHRAQILCCLCPSCARGWALPLPRVQPDGSSASCFPFLLLLLLLPGHLLVKPEPFFSFLP